MKEAPEAQRADAQLKTLFQCNAVLNKGLELQLIENLSCICNKSKLVIPKPLQQCAAMWYHHYLQHPGHTRFKETMKASIFWKRMKSTIWSIRKSCNTCQVNKRWTHKYRLLSSKIVASTPWEALCIGQIGPYTLKGEDGSAMDFMALTMINPVFIWFQIVELPFVMKLPTKMVYGKEKTIEERSFTSHLIT